MKENKLGEMVRFYRKKKGLTQEELGKLCGYSGKTAISKIELGVNDANTDTVIKIAKALGVRPVMFLEQFSSELYAEYEEYLPFLAEASDETIRNIRFMLKMPELKTKKNKIRLYEGDRLIRSLWL